MNPLDLSVVVPVYNEADNIASLIEEIQTALGDYFNYEIIYVDDGSTDATPSRLTELASAQSGLRVITHRTNYGQSAALSTGVAASRANWIATLDGDGQNDPADIPKLWAVVQNPDRATNLYMVAGYRRKRQDSGLKRISSRIANGVRGWLLQDNTPDTGCGLKLFARDIYLKLPYFDHMHRFLPALVQREGGQVVSVEVNHRPRIRGLSKYGLHNRLWVGIVDLLGVLWLQRRGCYPVIISKE